MDFPSDLYYTGEHEWARLEDDVATIGITDYAQGELGDIVFVELPQKGDNVLAGDVFGTIEAVKAVSELYSPIDGEIIEVNTELDDVPEVINSSPYEDGWMIKIRMSDPSQKDNLLSAEDYMKLIDES